MTADELRQLNQDELVARVRQWKEELFRTRINARTSEMKDTSGFGKLRKDIARGLTVLQEKKSGIVIEAKPAPVKKAAKSSAKETGAKKASDKAAPKKTSAKAEDKK